MEANMWLVSDDDAMGSQVHVFAHDRCRWKDNPRFQNLKPGWYWQRVESDDTDTYPVVDELHIGPFTTRMEAAEDAAKRCFD